MDANFEPGAQEYQRHPLPSHYFGQRDNHSAMTHLSKGIDTELIGITHQQQRVDSGYEHFLNLDAYTWHWRIPCMLLHIIDP